MIGQRNVVLGAAVLLALATPAAARPPYDGGRYVTAESQWGNGTVSGPVRRGQHGWQVRLPGGSWIDCVRSCSDTLRRQSIDFWQSNGPNAPGSARGYLHWEFNF